MQRTRINEDGEIERRCSKCGEWWYPTEEFFYHDKNKSDGLSLWCIACILEYWHKRHPPSKINIDREQRRAEILRLKENGKSCQAIADMYGVTRQAVSSMCIRTQKDGGKNGRYTKRSNVFTTSRLPL